MHPEIEALPEMSAKDFKKWVYALSREDSIIAQELAIGLLMEEEDISPGKQRAVVKYAFDKAKEEGLVIKSGGQKK